MLQDLISFKEEVLPKVIEELNASLKSKKTLDKNKENIIKIIAALNSKKNNDIIDGLHLLSRITEKELSNPYLMCQPMLSSKASEFELRRNNCFFSTFQKNFLDSIYWKDEESHGMMFKESKNPYFAGYQTSETRPYGVKPLTHGQRFFIDYEDKLESNKIYPFYFDSTYDSLIDYFLESMICGVDIQKNESMLTNEEPYRREHTWDVMGLREGFFSYA